MKNKPESYLNPYIAGMFLGIVLFISFLVFGHGLGASGGLAKITGALTDAVYPSHTERSAYLVGLMRDSDHPLDTWLVFEIIGIMIGGFFSGLLGGRIRVETFKGPRISNPARWGAAVIGGVLAGYGVRISRGCTSSQALSGGAVLSAGSWAFMFAVFAGAYMLAYFVRKLWN
jgi:uncharacterized membrane protein YedE/YeeE